MTSNDPYNLARFIEAQSRSIAQACKELQNGRKESHWMWFVFPQLRGLGHSAMANHYGISSLEEARAYLEHPILGSRLMHCTSLVLMIEGKTIGEIFEEPDDLKFCSSMTLFAEAGSDNKLFRQALDKYFGAEPDPRTIARLKGEG
jgi:uncharacterized protein (DUF1810 family)